MQRQIPAIITDIDGVLVRGKVPIPNVDTALWKIRNQLRDTNGNIVGNNIPFVALTNGGGLLQKQKARQLNEIFSNKIPLFKGEDIILNYTPLRNIMREYGQKKNQIALIAGKGEIQQIAVDSGMNNFITIEELSSIFSQNNFAFFKRNRLSKEKALEQVMNRLKVNNWGIKNGLKLQNYNIKAIFLLNDQVYWEDTIQACFDNVLKQRQNVYEQIPVYAVNNDITYADEFSVNRLAGGPFNFVLQSVFKKIFRRELNINIYGKPSKQTYDFTGKRLLQFNI